MSRKYIILLLIAIMILTVATGCGTEEDENKVGTVSVNKDSKYLDTFIDLNLGELFDFSLELTNADKSEVNIWVEGYKDGNLISEEPIAKLSYRFSPNQVEKGPLGLGIFNHNFNSQILIYSASAKSLTDPTWIEGFSLNDFGVSARNYAIGEEAVILESGQELLLGAYRQAEYSLKTVDYESEESIANMLEEDKLVLLFKIKVDVIED